MSAALRELLMPARHWPALNAETFRADLQAALTGALVVLPQGVAFATLAGLPPAFGLYSAMVPVMVAALWGSSWHVVTGPTNAISIFVFATLAPLAEPGSSSYIERVLALTFYAGVLQLLLGLARLGALVQLISHTVVVGFTAGAALLIMASQLGNFFGLPIARGSGFFGSLAALLMGLPGLNAWVLSVSAFTLAASLLLRRWRPRWPHMAMALVLGALLAMLFRALGPEQVLISTVGALGGALPPLTLPNFSLLRELAPAILAITLLGLTESISIGRAIALRSGQRIDGSREFVGQGLANVAGSFFSSYAASASFNRSGLNYEAGARSPLAALASAPFLLLLLLLVSPWAEHLPLAAMAGLLMVVAWGLIDWVEIRHILRVSRAETVILAITFFGTLLLPLEWAVLLGVLVSLVPYLSRTVRPPVREQRWSVAKSDWEDGEGECPRLRVLRIDGSVFFGAVDAVGRALARTEAQAQAHVVLRAGGLNFVDMAGADLLAREARLRASAGGGLHFSELKDEPRRLLQQAAYEDSLGAAVRDAPRGRESGLALRQRLKPRLDGCSCPTCQMSRSVEAAAPV